MTLIDGWLNKQHIQFHGIPKWIVAFIALEIFGAKTQTLTKNVDRRVHFSSFDRSFSWIMVASFTSLHTPSLHFHSFCSQLCIHRFLFNAFPSCSVCINMKNWDDSADKSALYEIACAQKTTTTTYRPFQSIKCLISSIVSASFWNSLRTLSQSSSRTHTHGGTSSQSRKQCDHY